LTFLSNAFRAHNTSNNTTPQEFMSDFLLVIDAMQNPDPNSPAYCLRKY